jgi:hypothetical protein
VTVSRSGKSSQEFVPCGEVSVNIFIGGRNGANGTGTDDGLPNAAVGQPDAGQPGEKFVTAGAATAVAAQNALTVKQTQKVEGRVGIFHVPVEVEITTASGRSFWRTASRMERPAWENAMIDVPGSSISGGFVVTIPQ